MAEADNGVNWRNIMSINGEIENQMSEDWKCIICKKMLINAHSGPCGCRYCLDCITTHLGGSKKYCPGKIRNCREKLLELNSNILYEQAVNIQISNTIVKCPQKSCEFKDELRRIKNHIRLCTSKSDKCPYFPIGCNGISMTDDQIKEHLQAENHLHLKLIQQWTDNFNNEMEAIKIDMSTTNWENCSLREEMNTIRVEIENKQATVTELKNRDNEIVKNISLLETKLVLLWRNVDKDKIEKRRFLMLMAISFGMALISMVFLMVNKTTSPENDHMDLVRKAKHLQQRYSIFEWQIENFTAQRMRAIQGLNTTIFSEPFFSHENGYKVCLQLFPNGETSIEGEYLSVFFVIMRGPFDELLPWPMDHRVILGLMNLKNRLSRIVYEVDMGEYSKYSETQKPTSDRNGGLGFPKFIKFDELLGNEELIKDDKLIITCKILVVLR